MKKIVKLFIIICVCFIPVMVDAKANLEFKDDYDNMMFFNEKNGEYFFIEKNKSLYDKNNVLVYDKNGNLLRRDSYFDEDIESSSNSISSSKYFDSYYKMYSQNRDVIYDEENDILYDVYYDTEEFRYYDSEDNRIVKGFNDDLEFTKKLLGKKYDAYLKYKESDIDVYSVAENNGYYIVYYSDSEYNNYVSILDKDFKIIKTLEKETYGLYIYDNLIYAMTNSNTMEIYKLDGSLLETLTISYDRFDSDSNYVSIPCMLYIKNNELFIMYYYHYDAPDLNPCNLDFNNFSMEKANGTTGNFLTLVYSLNYEVEKVETSNGDFTYTSKFDDDGREYVELKISPLKGYSVEDIIVTDINGKRIEVTNNRFYMPTSDVRIEVKFGEYVPIPDTALNKNIIITIIGIILVSLGLYMFICVKSEK